MDTFDVGRFAESAPELLGRLLRTRGTYADIFYEQTVVRQRGLRQRLLGRQLGRPKHVRQDHILEGAGLRALDHAAQGFAAVDGWDVAGLNAAAARVAAAIDGNAERSSPPCIVHDATDPAPPLPSESAVSAVLAAAADAAFALDPRVRHVHVTYQDRRRHVAIAASDGRLVQRRSLSTNLRVELVWRDDHADVTTHALAGDVDTLDVPRAEDAAREAVRRARMTAAARPAPTGRLPVVLAGGWGGVWLHEAVGHLLEADTFGDGPFSRKMGARVAPASVTLVDDATREGGRGTMAFDDEGTPARRTMLIDGGVLRGVLTDRRHAQQHTSTGNGRRQDYRHAPLPRMTNLCLNSGPALPADLVASVRQGIYVEMLGDGRVLPQEGRFSFDVLAGRRIERGRLTHPVTDLRIEGMLDHVLNSLTGLANDARLDTARGVCAKHGQVVPVSVSMPTVRLDGLRVVPTA